MATQQTGLAKNSFTDLGPTPMFLQVKGDRPVYYRIEATAPVIGGGVDIADVAQHRLGGEGDARDVAINLPNQRVYARGDGAVITYSF